MTLTTGPQRPPEPASHPNPARHRAAVRLWVRVRYATAGERGAVSIEYVIVAIALLAIAATIAAALDVLAADAVEQLPTSVSDAN